MNVVHPARQQLALAVGQGGPADCSASHCYAITLLVYTPLSPEMFAMDGASETTTYIFSKYGNCVSICTQNQCPSRNWILLTLSRCSCHYSSKVSEGKWITMILNMLINLRLVKETTPLLVITCLFIPWLRIRQRCDALDTLFYTEKNIEVDSFL